MVRKEEDGIGKGAGGYTKGRRFKKSFELY